jgi:hypothetical protein
MKLIDIAICIDNLDPKHMGRIRCVRYSSYTGEQEKATDYSAWDDKDLFTASPFLPTNINFIPEVGQTVKLIEYNTDKDFDNVEYIAGPFTTMHDYNSQTHSAQVENTTYGIAAKHSPDIAKSDKDELKTNDGAFARHTDYGIYGKYGSDVIFTENGLIMRGGKLKSKKGAKLEEKLKLTTEPILAEKSSSLFLKKFDKKLIPTTEETEVETVESKDLASFIEYSVSDFSGNGSMVDFYVHTIKPISKTTKHHYGENLYKTNNTNLENVEIISGQTFLNNVNGDTNPTFSIWVDKFEYIARDIRNIIKTIHSDLNLKSVYQDYIDNLLYIEDGGYVNFKDTKKIIPNWEIDLHPFYFRPTKESVTRTLTDEETTNRQTIFSAVSPATGIKQSGLIFASTSVNAPTKKVKKELSYLKNGTDGEEQSFGAIKSDKFYILSTDEPAPKYKDKKSIDFKKLGNYDLSQENYLDDVDPNTYALVRGEILLDILKNIADLFSSHVHLVETPLIQSDPNYLELIRKINNLENDMLNKSIRIN